jgi:hypothetical protein
MVESDGAEDDGWGRGGEEREGAGEKEEKIAIRWRRGLGIVVTVGLDTQARDQGHS